MDTDAIDHDELVARLTGGLAPSLDELPQFTGSDRLRPDGRPRPEFRAELRRIPNLRNAITVASAVAQPFVIVWATVAVDRWWAYPLAFVAMGSWFAKAFTLFHEGAHRLLFSSRRVNDLVGQWIFGWLPFGDGTDTYRLVHTAHHRDEFGPKEPDFALYARYPIPRDSMRRKLTRDALGVSGYKNIRPAIVGLLRPGYRWRAAKVWLGQAVVFGLFLVFGVPWLYVALWLAPWLTYWRVVNRLRSLAEHGGMTRSPDRRLTTHHIRPSIIPRVLFTPYNVGYHLAHHVDSGIPMWNVPKLHRALEEDGYWPTERTHPNYRSFWRTLVQSAPQDAPAGLSL